ncbi:MAG: nucleotidyltransferase domain-containing protein [Promethearchaeota archaeon]
MKKAQPGSILLPEKARTYLDTLIRMVKKAAADRIISILLFGSYAKGYADPEKSDLDLIIVLDDPVSQRRIDKVDRIAEGLETTLGFSRPAKTRIERLFRAIERATGMFASHFICRKGDILRGDFKRVFSISRTFGKILAPSKLVFNSVLSHVVTVFGDDISSSIRRHDIDIKQWLKSLLMCVLLSLSGFLAFLLDRKAGRFIREAAKWSLLNTYYYVNRRSPPFQKIIRAYSKKGLKTAERLLSHSCGFNIISAIKSPFAVIKIHVKGLKLLENSDL